MRAKGETVVEDLVRSKPIFPNSALEDFVIARGDGSPVFLLANVVDDLDEGITQVIRGEEHLSNMPKQQWSRSHCCCAPGSWWTAAPRSRPTAKPMPQPRKPPAPEPDR